MIGGILLLLGIVLALWFTFGVLSKASPAELVAGLQVAAAILLVTLVASTFVAAYFKAF